MRKLAETECRHCGDAIFLFGPMNKDRFNVWVHRDGKVFCDADKESEAESELMVVWETYEKK
jgi:hypothetical protein